MSELKRRLLPCCEEMKQKILGVIDKWKISNLLDADGNSLYKQGEFVEDIKELKQEIKELK